MYNEKVMVRDFCQLMISVPQKQWERSSKCIREMNPFLYGTQEAQIKKEVYQTLMRILLMFPLTSCSLFLPAHNIEVCMYNEVFNICINL